MKMVKKFIRSIMIMILLVINLSVLNFASKASNVVDDSDSEAILEVKYEYNSNLNQVIAKIISNIELQDTKPTWDLSEDKKTYIKVFSNNQTYSTPVKDKYGNIINVDISITQIKGAEITLKYIYDEETNNVTVKMISDIELQDTKPTWTLSEDKKIYKKIFADNQSYTTPVKDKYGNIINVDVNITQVKNTEITLEYIYDEKTNKVTAQMVSNIELKDTKPTWTLSQDKKVYTRIFDDNQSYSTPVQDKYGRVVNVDIEITQIDKKSPKITLEYKFIDNDTVIVYMKSNEKLGDTKPTWELNEDKLIYTRKFTINQDYSTPVQDIYGNITNVHIKFKIKKYEYTQTDNSKITVRYIHTSYNNVIVQIVSTVKMENTKPTWELSEDGYIYTKIFTSNTNYTTPIQDVNGLTKNVNIIVDFFEIPIKYECGTYGFSGAKVNGINGGTNLEYLRFGQGPNVMFATFCVHGFEDSWNRDGTVLVNIANDFYNTLVTEKDYNLANKWTIYIFPEVNPDGRRLGYTQNGPGRTTLYSKVGKGIDINRSWQTGSTYKIYTDNRNYNGTAGFQAYEAEYLRNFLLSHKSTTGQTVLVDLHGWQDQLIGNEQICSYYKQQYTSCSTRNYGNYGTQYLVSWARQNLGAKAALIELPMASSEAQANSMGLSKKYINATLNMLRGI